LHCDEAIIDGRNVGKAELRFHYNRVTIGGEEISLDTLQQISGIVRELQIPREAMGRGDLKFLAAIGAFLGWRAVLFSVFAGSLFGSLVGLVTMLVGRRVWSAKIPFGPYLAFGGLLWMFFGESLLSWYFSLLGP
jgi:leader peptidase (prepilin peptidase)/N-methyltransferase